MTILSTCLTGFLICNAAPQNAPDQSALIGTPIHLRKKGDLYEVQLSVSGKKPGWFVLDTGGHRSYVTEKGINRLHDGGVKIDRTKAFVADDLSLGDFRLSPVTFILDKKAGRFSLDPEADGVVGVDVLSRFRLGLDLRGRVMRLWPAETKQADVLDAWFGTSQTSANAQRERESVAELFLWRITNGLFGTTLTLNDIGLAATVDTGSPVSIIETESQGDAFNDLNKIGGYRARFYEGVFRVDRFDADGRIRLGSVKLGGKRSIGRARLPGGGGSILGCDVLEDLKVLLDFPCGQIFVRAVGTPDIDR